MQHDNNPGRLFNFYKKYYGGKLGLMISVCVDDLFIERRMETLENIKDIIKLKFNIQESGKKKNFLEVYYNYGNDAKGPYAKITMEKDVNKLVNWYDKFTGSDVKIHKTPGDTGTNLCKSELNEPT